jgi:hypothetical protein
MLSSLQLQEAYSLAIPDSLNIDPNQVALSKTNLPQADPNQGGLQQVDAGCFALGRPVGRNAAVCGAQSEDQHLLAIRGAKHRRDISRS